MSYNPHKEADERERKIQDTWSMDLSLCGAFRGERRMYTLPSFFDRGVPGMIPTRFAAVVIQALRLLVPEVSGGVEARGSGVDT